MPKITNQVRKRVILRAPLERVWHAITDSKEYGTWFGVELDGPFVAGKRIEGRMAPTKVDPDVAAAQEPYAGMRFTCHVETIEPMRLFSFRWHPYDVEENAARTNEPMTLVTFELEEIAGSVELTITESGFDELPAERRQKAFTMNEEGWTAQLKLIEKYLDGFHAS